VRPIGQSWRRHDWAELVIGTGGRFRNVEHARFPFVLDLPRARLDDHLLSYSGLASLPDEDRGRLFTEVAAILDSDSSIRHGERLELPFVVDAYRAVRI
jgi:hypothetical protein